MNIVILIIILAVLILVHELGHFLVAKKFGIKVDEFGLGFPPRIFGVQKLRKGEIVSEKIEEVSVLTEKIPVAGGNIVAEEIKDKVSEKMETGRWHFVWGGRGHSLPDRTIYSLNWISLGGFVRIFGENPEEAGALDENRADSFARKNHAIQIAVLAAGVIFNLLFAWAIFSAGFMFGMPTSVSESNQAFIKDAKLTITNVLPKSPAEIAGLKAGDEIISLKSGTDFAQNLDAKSVSNFIGNHGGVPVSISIKRGAEILSETAAPKSGIIASQPGIGIAMDLVGLEKLPFGSAIIEGAKTTYDLTQATVYGTAKFIYHAFTGRAKLSEVSGPVGIAGVVGDAEKLGFAYLISLAAFISINLAVINFIPFPALDGGRILFAIIESIKRSPIKPKVANTLNTIGFALLLLLMVVVTFSDVAKIIK